MSAPELSDEQRAALQSLVTSNRLRVVPSDLDKAERFFFQSQEALNEVSKIEGSKLKHSIAYDCAHDIAEAILAAYGFSTTNGNGQHQTLAEVLVVFFAGTEAEIAAENFEQLRSERNSSRYRSIPIGQAQAELAVQCAKTLLNVCEMIGLKVRPV